MTLRGSLSGILIATLFPMAGSAHAVVAPARAPETIDLPRIDSVFDASYTRRMNRSPGWRSFLGEHGEEWRANWDLRTGVPRWIMGPGIHLGRVDRGNVEGVTRDFVRAHAELFRLDPEELRLAHARRAGGRWFVVYERLFDGLPVLGARLDLRIMPDGRLTLIGVNTHPELDLDTRPEISAAHAAATGAAAVHGVAAADRPAKLVIVPIADRRELGYALAWQVVATTADPPGRWVQLIDAVNAVVIARHNEIRYAQIGGKIGGPILPVTPSDEPEYRDFAYEDISIDAGPDIQSDETGTWRADVSAGDHDVESRLEGLWVRVRNMAGSDAALAQVAPANQRTDLVWDDENSLISERNVYFHTGVVHDYMKSIDPGFNSLDYDMRARVEAAGSCNAFWDGFGMTFYRGGGGCPSIGKIADVIYHEYGHGVTQWASGGNATGAMHEGFSDYLAVTIMNDSRVGRGFFGPGSHLRDCVNERVYPAPECGGEVHCVGETHCGALWDARANLIDVLGEESGVALSDSLWHFARYGHADNDMDYYVDYLLMDDDDGDLSNGTPHGAQLYPALADHGFVEMLGLASAVMYDAEAPDLVADPGDQMTLVVEYLLPAGAMAATELSASLRSLSTKLQVTKQNSSIPDLSPGEAGDNSQDPFLLEVDAGISEVEDVQLIVDLSVEPNFFSRSDTLDVRIGRGGLLLVDDDPTEDFAHYYEEPLAELGSLPNRWTRRATPELGFDPLAGFETVIWFCGNATTGTLDPGERALLTDHFERGGNLLLSGKNIGQEIGSDDFFSYYLKSEHVQDDAMLPLAEGVETDPLSSEWLLFFTGEGGADNWDSPDAIRALGGARDALVYAGTALGAGVVYEGGYRLVYLPFNLEGVSGGNDSTPLRRVLSDVLQLFGVPVGLRAVELSALALPEGNRIAWRLVGAGAELAGVQIDRVEDGRGTRLNDQLIVRLSEFLDQDAQADGLYRYRITTVDAETGEAFGSHEISVRRGQGPGIPSRAALAQNSPNPFNPVTTISFDLPQASLVELVVYDLGGRRVKTLADRPVAAGRHAVRWNGSAESGAEVPSGVYLYRIRAGSFSASRRMLLIK